MLYVNPKNPAQRVDSPYSNSQAIQIVGTLESDFAKSLFSQWKSRGLSEPQMYWVHKLAVDHEQKTAKAKSDGGAVTVLDSPSESNTKLASGVFKKLRTMFDRAAVNLTTPKVRFATPKGLIALSVAKATAKVPGSINVVLNGDWVGRIVDGDTYQPGQKSSQTVVDIVVAFSDDPVKMAREYGRRTGNCCFCHRTLTDERSIYVGYGPICADHYGLPWGEVAAEREVHHVS